MQIVYRVVKIYVDGHLWSEKIEEVENEPDVKAFFDEPGLVGLLITRQSMRRVEND